MKHADHGGIADLPDLPYWRNRGWEPADGPPPEPDLLHDPVAPETPGLSVAPKSAATAKSKKES